LIRFCFFTGLFFWLLKNGPDFSGKIIASLWQMGGQASGSGNAFYPAQLINIGLQVLQTAMNHISFLQPESIFAPTLIALIILIVCALVSVNMILLLCAAWVVLYAGVIFLAFGALEITRDMAVSYFRTALGIGVSLMTLQLIIRPRDQLPSGVGNCHRPESGGITTGKRNGCIHNPGGSVASTTQDDGRDRDGRRLRWSCRPFGCPCAHGCWFRWCEDCSGCCCWACGRRWPRWNVCRRQTDGSHILRGIRERKRIFAHLFAGHNLQYASSAPECHCYRSESQAGNNYASDYPNASCGHCGRRADNGSANVA
jgi:hypothetical protein